MQTGLILRKRQRDSVSTLPPPLTPADSDLRDFTFMPLDVVRLRDSDISAISSGDEFRCAVLLWCASWHQVPAASLPDDDKVLAQYAGFGRVVKEWMKIREGALRSWIKCADGRLYHPVVAEKANEAWAGRVKHREKKEADAKRKADERRLKKMQEEADHRAMEEALQRGGHGQDSNDMSAGQTGNVQRTDTGNPLENPLKEKETGTGTVDRDSGQGQLTTNPEAAAQASTEVGAAPPVSETNESMPRIGQICKLLRAFGINTGPAALEQHDWPKNPKATDDIIETAVEIAKTRKPLAIVSVNYLRPIIDELLNPPPPPPPRPEKDETDQWWRNDAGIERKGRELGLFARGSEDHSAFKARIFEHLKKQKGGKP